MSALYVFAIDPARHVYRVQNTAGGKFTVTAQDGQCGCATWKKTRSCCHTAVVERLLKRKLPLGPKAVCPQCDNAAALRSTCAVCAQTGYLLESEARALRQACWGGRTEAQNRALWRRLGGETEIAPKTRVWPHKDAQGIWHFEAEEEPREAAA